MIHLGYELGTGTPVSIPLAHLAVTGQTQQAGKTTTLEALITRANVRALTFVTKRGEGAFTHARRTAPYFRERADWQYVSAILEATLRERLKFERSWIMQACKGAQTLTDVQRNVERQLKKAKGLSESVLTTLHAYLEIVTPQITSTRFAPKLELERGINVMDLTGFQFELQALIIRSAIEWIHQRETQTIVIIPEAWEFVPQARSSPVKLACEQLIRKGAGLQNFVWLDSQDIAGIHKDILRSVSVWLFGVQREHNEVSRVLKHLPMQTKPNPREIAQLQLGQFVASYGPHLYQVYVQPAGMPEAEAIERAQLRTTANPNHALDRLFAQSAPQPAPEPLEANPTIAYYGREVRQAIETIEEDENMWKEKYEALKVEFDELTSRFDRLQQHLYSGQPDAAPPAALEPKDPAGMDWQTLEAANGHQLPAIFDYIVDRLRTEPMPPFLQLLVTRPEIEVAVRRPTLELDDTTLRGRLAELIADGFFDQGATGHVAFVELQRHGFRCSKPNVYRELDKLAELRVVTKEDKLGFVRNPTLQIRRLEK